MILTDRKQILLILSRLFLAALLLECFFFNFRHWESLFYPDAAPSDIRAGAGMEEVEPGVFRVVDSESAVVELLGIRASVKSLFLGYPENAGRTTPSIPVQIMATDAGNSAYYSLPETEIAKGIPESQYIRLYLSGVSEKIAVRVTAREGAMFSVSDFQLNAVRPFWFRPVRFLVVFTLGTLLFLFRPSSPLYQVRLDLSRKNQQHAMLAAVLLNLGLLLFLGHVYYDPTWKETGYLANLQYNLLTESLRAGHTWLDLDPPQALASITNPYDPAMRAAALQASGESIPIDFAYWDGRYYCYFGVAPVILFYLPCLLLTGKWLSTGLLIIVLSCVFVLAVFWLLYELIRKYFPQLSLGIYLLLAAVLLAGSEVTYCIQVPTIYSVPFICSLVLVALGLSCWLHAARPDGCLHKRWLIAGSVFIALTVGCRPQFAIATLFAFPIFWKEIRAGEFFSRRGTVNTLCVMLPYLLIDVWFLYYNFIRFENILDFGATYNLTGFDMTHKSFQIDSFWLGFYEYFFQPFHVLPRFPYISVITDADWSIARDFQAQVNSEPMLGGFFAFNLIGVFLFGFRRAKPELKAQGCYAFTWSLTFAGILLAALDIQMVGLTLRYLTDFSFFLMLASMLVIFALLSRYKENHSMHRFLLAAVVLMSVLCICTNYYTLLAEGRFNPLENAWAALYYKLKYWGFAPLGIR